MQFTFSIFFSRISSFVRRYGKVHQHLETRAQRRTAADKDVSGSPKEEARAWISTRLVAHAGGGRGFDLPRRAESIGSAASILAWGSVPPARARAESRDVDLRPLP